MTDEEIKTANEQATSNAITLVKGWTRPLIFIGLSAVVGVMAVQLTLDTLGWQFWTIYRRFLVWRGGC